MEEYLRPQRRFAHLFKGAGQPEVLARLQAVADRNIRRYGLIEEDRLDPDVLERVLAAPDDPEGRYDTILHAAASTRQGQAAQHGAQPTKQAQE